VNLLIAEDDAISRAVLSKRLADWGYPFVTATDGEQAWEAYQAAEINFVITDWMMPRMGGIELTRRIRACGRTAYTYVILLTAKSDIRDLVEAMEAGADDFVTKPFDKNELYVRIQAGRRVLALEADLAAKIRALEESAAHIRDLQQLLPICMYCKKIRQGGDYWQQVEHYIARHANVQFSHGICPECFEKYCGGEHAVPPLAT
jgi:DNA-binding response OmpR family regulator